MEPLDPYPGNLRKHEVKPLLSDESLAHYRENLKGTGLERDATGAAIAVRDIYEEDRKKAHALIQVLVDATHSAAGSPYDDELCSNLSHAGDEDNHRAHEPCPVIRRINAALSLAAEQGFIPTSTI